MKRRFFQRYALVILMLVFFLVPFGLRGARMAVRDMRNDVRDWLPDRFQETHELEEFRRYFWGEAFIVLSWDGCTGSLDDQRFRMLVNKFFPELSPSERALLPPASKDDVESTDQFADEELNLYTRQLMVDSPLSVRPFVGNRFGFYYTGDYHENWGGLEEKWLRGDLHKWYYILPSGDIYEWKEADTLFASGFRSLRRLLTGAHQPQGELVASLGPLDGPWYYQNPRRLDADLFKSVVTGPSILHELVRPGGALEGDTQKAMQRLQGVLFSEDGQRTCVVVTLSERARQNLHLVAGRGLLGKPRGKLLLLADESGLEPPQPPTLAPPGIATWLQKPFVPTAPLLRLGGPPIDNVAIDEEGQATLARLVGLSTLLGVAISWLSFRNFLVTLMLFFVGGVGAIASLSFVWWGSQLDAVLMTMPSLVYVLGLSGAVHIVNYYRDTVEQDGFPGSPEKAMGHGWKPCTLAAITTALGLISLAYSDIVPIRKFGFFSAIGVVFTLALLFSFLPAALSLWPPQSFARAASRTSGQFNIPTLIAAFWCRVGVFAVRRHRFVLVVAAIVLIVSALGLPRIQTTVQLLKLFDPRSKIIEDYTWLEANLCKLVPMELLVRVNPRLMGADEIKAAEDSDATGDSDAAEDEKFRLSFLERLELTEQIRESVDAQFGPGHGDITGTAMLASTFLPPLPRAGGSSRQAARRGAYSRRLATYRNELLASDYFRLHEDDQSELWRVSLRLNALSDVDYGQFVFDLKQAVEPVLSSYFYRDQILRAIDQHRAGRGFRGGRVLLLGAPFGKSRFADRPQAVPPQAEPIAAAGNDTSPQAGDERLPRITTADQVRVFSVALLRLLKNAALNYRDWHDPAFELPDDFADRIADFDCVVVIQDDPRYDLATLEARAPHVIDARDCVFDPYDGTPTAAENKWPISVVYTGLVPVVYKAQRTLLQSLIQSVGWAFVAISIVMVFLLRSPQAGLMSMLPNVFPVVLIFGCMGWLSVLVDIGTMMTASVAMGVAVDDTIHFLTWFRHGITAGLGRKGAIELAYDRCATAMTQTTLIGGLGLAVFALSTFTPTQRFGVLMLTLMTAALVGDLVVLPALLASRIGRVFEPKSSTGRGPARLQPNGVDSHLPAPGKNGPLSQPATDRHPPSGGDRSESRASRSGEV